jgi:hypothetical protein
MNRSRRYSLVVYLHLASLLAEVRKRIEDRREDFGDLHSAATSQSRPVVRESLITVRPVISNVFANPPEQTVVWEDDVQPVEFQIRYKDQSLPDTLTGKGTIDISIDQLVIAQIPISVSVESQEVAAGARIETAQLLSRVFASYARTDFSIVQACKETYRLINVHLFVDTDDVLSGEAWRKRINAEIARTEIFQLFWSKAASNSANVRNEIDLAKDVAGQRAYRFIRPSYWEADKPPLPQDLGHLNFTRIDLGKLNVRESLTDRRSTQAPATVPVRFPVLSLEPGTENLEGIIQDAMCRVVPFLENLTGLRYYPAPTLLVDDFIVKSVRKVVTVDQSQPADSTPPNVQWAIHVLRSLGLAFHVRSLHEIDNVYMDDEKSRRFFGITAESEWKEYEFVQRAAEGSFIMDTGAYLEGSLKPERLARTLSSPIARGQLQTFAQYAARFLELLAMYGATAERIRGAVSINIGYSVPGESLKALKRHAPEIQFTSKAERAMWGEQLTGNFTWSLTLTEYNRALSTVTHVILNAIKAIGGKPVNRYLSTSVPTYGIFASGFTPDVNDFLAKAAQSHKWPAAVVLPGAGKVLISANAVARYRSDLQRSGLPESDSAKTATAFLESVLVHEHLHGILETGVGATGKTSAAADSWDEWAKGFSLNEAIAAWVQWHYFRNDTPMSANIQAYISSGEYPEWPYRAAESIEKIYLENGLPGVVSVMETLRRDPELAQTKFDEYMK